MYIYASARRRTELRSLSLLSVRIYIHLWQARMKSIFEGYIRIFLMEARAHMMV